MKPYLTELFGTEMLFLIGIAGALAVGAGAGSSAVLTLFGGLAGVALMRVSLAGQRSRRTVLDRPSA